MNHYLVIGIDEKTPVEAANKAYEIAQRFCAVGHPVHVHQCGTQKHLFSVYESGCLVFPKPVDGNYSIDPNKSLG